MATSSANKTKQNPNKPMKRNKLRYLEYYDFQQELDNLYINSSKGLPFYNLMDLILDARNINLAYRTIKTNKGSKTKGTDNQTILDWENKTPDYYHKYIRSRLLDYNPKSVRRVEIPKENGKMRPLGIPTIGDRLIQQCILQVLEPICEAKFFKHSYGFRPNRSTKDAIAYFQALINKSDCYFVVDMDIKGFFDNVSHSKLLKQLWAFGIRDKNLISIISKMLKAEIVGEGIPNKGVPQGGILSPVLSNIVLNELDYWIANQWETFETEHTYYSNPQSQNTARYRALRNKSKLKEIYLVRYADDFKIVCRTMKQAKKIFIATQSWLKERLELEISPEKSKIVDVRENASEFLGISFKAVKIGIPPKKRKTRGKKANLTEKIVIHSHITDKSKKKIKDNLMQHIKKIQKEPSRKNVNLYNSAVLGMQQYYQIATHVNIDFTKIAFDMNKVIRNRTSQYQMKVKRNNQNISTELSHNGKAKNKGSPKFELSKTYKKFYKNNYRIVVIAKTALFPIGDVQTKAHMRFTQEICNYTISGRKLIHSNIGYLDMNILHYLMRNPLRNKSIKLNDNRLSLFSEQCGLCGVTGEPLSIGNMEVHHKLPTYLGGTDAYNNLIIVTYDVHKLIHATNAETINFYLNRLKLKANHLKKLNKLRELVGNSSINIAI